MIEPVPPHSGAATKREPMNPSTFRELKRQMNWANWSTHASTLSGSASNPKLPDITRNAQRHNKEGHIRKHIKLVATDALVYPGEDEELHVKNLKSWFCKVMARCLVAMQVALFFAMRRSLQRYYAPVP